ncbi:disease resistance protein RPV1-like [Telopea speciosissima]|uniref:disease resistance protein RPV1-like n=1 Tax=Telopea speciosissima TaxID=54955 RepID=UPI001CC59F37|nr:disease resistance protein RPV1-like [Telopea speciosissima]
MNEKVFLSFHGKDVRTNFADCLYNSLIDAGIRTFRDSEELHKGNKIGSELIAAIQGSRISIPIFSANYSSSKWCLKELTQISECRRTMNQIVLPIFYKVEPRDVRNQTGIYAKAFEEHQINMGSLDDMTMMQKWKEAMREVGELDGWHSKEDTYEGKLIKIVVKTVGHTLNKRPLSVSNNLVGIQFHIKEMLMLLDIESNDRKIVGIHGLGGIGKTTIARAVYNRVFHNFEGCSFIANVRETADQRYNGLVHLQKQLILDILKEGNEDITSVDDGIKVIQQRFCAKKVLIVLDDVDRDIQVKSLVGDRKWFGVGSRIIITTRDKQILCVQDAEEIYEPRVMHKDDSLQLFSHHAFRSEQPPENYLDLSEAMVKTTGRLPLALEVIGSSLYLKGKVVWDGMLKKLQKVPNNDVMERLKISYDALEDELQQMFLDTACFFIGMDKDIICHIWDGCGFFSQVGLDALCVRSLVTISEKGELGMHDLLRDLGRNIVHQENIDEPGMRTRIWSQEDALDVLDRQTGTNNVKGFSIDFGHISRSQCLMGEGLATMTRLRLLQVNSAQYSGKFTNSFSELRWLSWRGCPEQYALSNFHPCKLVVLDLSYSKITENWMGWNYIKVAEKLKVLNLTSCDRLCSTPDISANQHLEVFLLKNCKNLDEVDTSICCLTNLVILNMSGCGRLKKLPEKLGSLVSLTELDLGWCKSLVDLPSEVCKLSSLKKLNLIGCQNLKKLPEKFGRMISLIELGLTFVESVVDFPSEISQLTALKSLSLGSCRSLTSISCIPSSLTRLHVSGCGSIRYISGLHSASLTSLDVHNCSSIGYISGLHSTSLTSLDVRDCSSIRYISGLHTTSLTSFSVWNCSSIQYISGLPSSLTYLHALNCKAMVKLSSTSGEGLRNLKTLKLSDCEGLEEIEGVDDKLDSLEVFNIFYCKSLKKLPKLTGSKNLRILNLYENDFITDFEGEGMESLEVLEIRYCISLRKIPSLRDSKRLRILKIEDCPKLSEIEGLEDYESLQELSINGVRSLKTLPEDISTTLEKNLSYLRINDCCYSMERLPDLSNFKELRELYIGHYRKSMLRLWELKIEEIEEDWRRLSTKIPGLDRLAESLRKLGITGCRGIRGLPDLSNFKKLNYLMIGDCKNLTEIHGINRLENLEFLEISGCESLKQRLLDLSNLQKLNYLRIEGFKILTEIQGIEVLESLSYLDISRCESLEILPDLSNLKYLITLNANDCKKLTEIQDGLYILGKITRSVKVEEIAVSKLCVLLSPN